MAAAGILEPQIATALMLEIQKIERGTDLKRVAIISRAGMKMATSGSDQMDADAETASSAALIDLAEKLSESTQHGNLREIVVKAASGFVILQFINTDYMVFGGISDPLKVGFYLEYLRNQATKFAYIIAGNQLTAEIKKEIEAHRDRDAQAKIDAKKSLAEDFKVDKSTQQDMDAMKDVLSFLNDWGGKEADVKPSENNIVGIDKDLLFGMQGAESLAPTPISQEQISQAKNATTKDSDQSILDDIANVVSSIDTVAAKPAQQINSPSSSRPVETPSSSGSDDGGLPDDILSALNEIAETTKPTQKEIKKAEAAQSLPYGIILYDGEVPPIPLNDYVSFEVGTLTGQKFEETGTTSVPESNENSEPVINEQPQYSETPQSSSPIISAPPNEAPNFQNLANEYDDGDLNLEEDAMLQALNELNINPTKDDKAKKQSSRLGH